MRGLFSPPVPLSLPPPRSRTPRGNLRLLRTPSTTVQSYLVERWRLHRLGRKQKRKRIQENKSHATSSLSPRPSLPSLHQLHLRLLLPRPASLLSPRYHIRRTALPARAVMAQRIRPDIDKRPDRLGEHGEENDEPARPGVHVAPVFWHVEVPPDEDEVRGYAAEVAGQPV